MNSRSPGDALSKLILAAKKNRTTVRASQTRIVVQVGHCSQAVKADEVFKTMVALAPKTTSYVVEAGCDGACFEAPKVIVTDPSGSMYVYTRVDVDKAKRIAKTIDFDMETPDSECKVFFDGQKRIALDMCGQVDPCTIDDYVSMGGYGGFVSALSMTPDQVIEEVKSSGLRGKGGAYFPSALKWEGAKAIHNSPRYLVVNAEEGEPGIFKDRHLMEGIPHRIIEGACIAAYASNVHEGYIYINAEANLATNRMSTALKNAYDSGLLGDNILGSGFNLHMEIRRGAGGYVCGEETTLLNTMEGYRREPRLRPPYPTESGLWAKPTVINNPETLASVPFILANGSRVFSKIGSDKAKGTKIVSLSGSVKRPGIVEIPMGTMLRDIIYNLGGGTALGYKIIGVAIGGPSSGIFPPSMLDTQIAPGPLHESGVMLGAGGVIVLDERVGIIEAIKKLATYNATESCGKCTPCREGTPRIVETLDRLTSGTGSNMDLEELSHLAKIVKFASLCGLGQAAGTPVNSAIYFFKAELDILTRSSSGK